METRTRPRVSYEKAKEYALRWNAKNPERVIANKRAYYIKNRDRLLVANARWRKEHPLEYSTINRLQRHKRRALGPIKSTEWIAKVKMLENRCQHCGKTEPEVKITIDHIVPVSKGGTNHIDNLQPLCLSCNQHKSARIE